MYLPRISIQTRSQGGLRGLIEPLLLRHAILEILLDNLHCSANIQVAKLEGTIIIFTILQVGIVTIFTNNHKPARDCKCAQVMNINFKEIRSLCMYFHLQTPICEGLVRVCYTFAQNIFMSNVILYSGKFSRGKFSRMV